MKFNQQDDFSGYDRWISGQDKPYPSVGETDEDEGGRVELPTPIRNERDVCRVCGFNSGGTVGAKNPRINWITCHRCKAEAAKGNVA